MALCSEVKPLQIVPVHLVQPLKPNSPTHLAMSQVELVACLLKDMGTENSGFTISNVMKVGVWVYSTWSVFCCCFIGAYLSALECLVNYWREFEPLGGDNTQPCEEARCQCGEKRIAGSKSVWKNLSVWRFLPLQWNNCLRLISP